MSLEAHKALARRAIRMWASDNADDPEEVFSENYVNHQESDVTGGVRIRSLADWKELVDGFHQAFSNCRADAGLQIAEGDLVATRFAFTATHTGEYMTAAPTGRDITWTGVEIDRIDGGRIVESWVDWDKYRFFEGLGLVK